VILIVCVHTVAHEVAMADSAVEYVLLADTLRLPLDAVKTPCVCKRHVTSCRTGK
jgi:hypothetical protein